MAHARKTVETALKSAWSKSSRKRPLRKLASGDLLTLQQAAAALGMGVRTLREHMRSGAIGYVDIGRGKVRRAPRFAPQDVTEFQEKHRGTSWPSTSEARSTTMSSSFGVLDFAALRAAGASGKRKSSSGPSGKRRRRKPTVVKL
jgi:hypothetical protein